MEKENEELDAELLYLQELVRDNVNNIDKLNAKQKLKLINFYKTQIKEKKHKLFEIKKENV